MKNYSEISENDRVEVKGTIQREDQKGESASRSPKAGRNCMITAKLSLSSGLRAQLQGIGMATGQSNTLICTAFTGKMPALPASIIWKITV